MRVIIDGARCTGALNCADLAPGAFRAGPDGRAIAIDPPGASDIELLEAAENCPTGAITVTVEPERSR